MNPLRKSPLGRQLGGFLAVGATNTLITLLVYEGLLLIVHYAVAYAIAVLVGFIYSLLANGKLVFRASITARRTGLYFLVTVFNLLAGLGVLHLLIGVFGVPRRVAPLFVIGIMLPANFLLTRFALTGKAVSENRG